MEESQKKKYNGQIGQKGYTGNPHGRPKKGNTMRDLKDKLLDAQEVDIKGVKYTGKEALILKAYQLAMQGDTTMLKHLIGDVSDDLKSVVSFEDGEGNSGMPIVNINFIKPARKDDDSAT